MTVFRIAIMEPSALIAEGLRSVLSKYTNGFRRFDGNDSEMLKSEILAYRPTLLLINENYLGIDTPDFIGAITEKINAVPIGISYGPRINGDFFKDSINIFDAPDKIVNALCTAAERQQGKENTELSEREKDIIKFVVQGMTNKEIADKLHLSIHTIHTHRKNIANKLNIRSSAGLTIYAILNNIINIDDANI